jgi:tricorn protease
LITILALAGATAWAGASGTGMIRFPDVSDSQIVFRYSNDLWLAPITGGTAIPLASPPGEESFPKFSPDGKTIAFMGNYDGNQDLYTIPAAGGEPFRVTYHPTGETLCDWTPENELIFFAGGIGLHPRTQELFTVSAAGGLPKKMPVPYGANGAVSADGKWLAYTPHSRDFRNWKRYRGGMATDIWLFSLQQHTSEKITDWEGTDTYPMWHGEMLYYLSDNGAEHRLNIWSYDTSTGTRTQVTDHEAYDVKWPSSGPNHIVYQLGAELRLLDLAGGNSAVVPVTIPGARPQIRVQLKDAAESIFSRALSPTGKRVAVDARGDVWTLPAKHGSPVNFTRTSGSAERYPSWSPDKKWIAWFSDETGEYQMYIIAADGSTEAEKVTDLPASYYFQPSWSPNSAWIAFWEKSGKLYLYNVESKEAKVIEEQLGPGATSLSWAHDSNWLAWSRGTSLRGPNQIFFYEVAAGKKHQVTDGMFGISWPTFDREGKFLYFASNRDFSNPIYSDVDSTWVYTATDRLYAVPLNADVENPLAPKSDDEKIEEEKGEEKKGEEEKGEEKKEGKVKEGEKGKDKEGDDKAGEEKKEPLKIDLEGFERRAIALPMDKGAFFALCVNDGHKLIFAKAPAPGTAGPPTIHLFDFDDEKEKLKTVAGGVNLVDISADGKKLLVVNEGGAMAIIGAAPDQKLEEMVPTGGMLVTVNPREEWRQIFNEVWRRERDFFYDPNMHGVDWEGVRKQYAPLIEECSSREDVGFILREVIAELNVGHTYYFGGDNEIPPELPTGMLGCDFELDRGAYRISRIFEGGPWDVDGRGPLSQPGVDVKAGDYLLAVNGVPLDAAKAPWAAFVGKAGQTVRLTVSEEPESGEKDRQVLVMLVSSEDMDLRYRAWVEANRKYVDRKSGGKVGYIYVPNTGIEGQSELVRQFVGQIEKEALIIDERWNGGGQVPTRFIELLNRPITNYWSVRDLKGQVVWPQDAHHGPKCMLINGLAGSGGDHFPYLFKHNKLGKLIGTRTWGGLVGIGGGPPLLDGAGVTTPSFAFYDIDGTWGIEGHGVDPDIEVVDDPALMVDGDDPQLDRAIEQMLEEAKTGAFKAAPVPAWPDRSGMGLPESDH